MKHPVQILNDGVRRYCGVVHACLCIICGFAFAFATNAQTVINRNYLNPNLPISQRVESLLNQMTLDEKIGQMFMGRVQAKDAESLAKRGLVGSFVGVTSPAAQIEKLQKDCVENSRLGIPALFGLDVIHGYSTIFPIPLAQASSWDPELVKQCAAIAGQESASQGIRWTMSPMVDIARDPRWGRIAEGSGEDPFLGMAMAKAMVEGYQGPQLNPDTHVVACVKHFVGYGAAEGGRDYDTTEISERTLREIYLPPFQAAVDAGAATFMSSFNDLNGIPASANPFIMRGILKGEWNYQGIIRADANADSELVNHGIARDPEDAALKAVSAGLDLGFAPYHLYLAKLVADGKIPLSMIDDSTRRMLRIKFEIGLFEHPYVKPDKAKKALLLPEYRQATRQEARESIVLLKNKSNLLPLAKSLKTIALIGPLAKDKADILGCWNTKGTSKSAICLLDAIKAAVAPGTKVLYAEGCGITNASTNGFSAALAIARQADVIILAVGEAAAMSGEGASRSSLDLPGWQPGLVMNLCRLGKPMVEVLMNGRPLTISWDAENVPAILETWQLGTEAGNAIADVLFGDYNPGGKLPVTFPRTAGQIPIFYNHKSSGRPAETFRFTAKYQDLPWTPLYPFGYGLSYTTFEFSDLKTSPDPEVTDQFQISVTVKNTGRRGGSETAQLYIRQKCASITRPVKQLEGFQKLNLAPGESRNLNFTLTPDDLSFYDMKMQRVVEPGPLEVMVGDNSAEVISNQVQIDQPLILAPACPSSFGNL